MKHKPSIKKQIEDKSRELKKLHALKKTQVTDLKVSKNTARIVDLIKAQLNDECRSEMDELRIKRLNRDDTITALLVVAMSQFEIPLEELDHDNNYLRIIELQQNNNIVNKEAN
jgi:predicted  nucleic acid-binding Zn-ribbon protein